ncbi:eukaryotic translation initiation factor 2A-like isoform X2 [Magnolia sinica]|uniref:eukaryotic translation initiation factor 2A-like isoform X2 n=1 Tax=Magnolia sinica TaxID=86752 RepID=UPI00265B5613|nr:eukaryotic translation initiation factor 2A-like isoform X2 [Magnolia sinica]
MGRQLGPRLLGRADDSMHFAAVIMRIRELKTTALIFVSVKMGIPASVQIFSHDKDAQAQPVAWRSFFRCSTVQLHWNYGATGLPTAAQSNVDKTNHSYCGESKLNYLTIDGSHEGLVPLRMIFKLIG